MHAPSHRGSQTGLGKIPIRLGKIAAAALLPLLPVSLAACSNGQSDTPAIQPPSTAAPGVTAQATPGPQVTITKVNGLPVPQLAGKTTANNSLRQIGSNLSGTCSVAVERDDSRLGSFLWTCTSGKRTAATFDQRTQRQVTLDDLLQGGYRSYLTSTAVAQMKADGVSSPSATDFSVWYATTSSLVVAFPDSTVSFPVGSLGGYIRPGGPLG